MNSAAVNMGMQVSLLHADLHSLNICPESIHIDSNFKMGLGFCVYFEKAPHVILLQIHIPLPHEASTRTLLGRGLSFCIGCLCTLNISFALALIQHF
jgi:hypothetical protein